MSKAAATWKPDWLKLMRHLRWWLRGHGFRWIPDDEQDSIVGLAAARANRLFDPAKWPNDNFDAGLRKYARWQLSDVLRDWLKEHEQYHGHSAGLRIFRYTNVVRDGDDVPTDEVRFGGNPRKNWRWNAAWDKDGATPEWWHRLTAMQQQTVLCRARGDSLKDIGRVFGVTAERVRQRLKIIGNRLKVWGVTQITQ